MRIHLVIALVMLASGCAGMSYRDYGADTERHVVEERARLEGSLHVLSSQIDSVLTSLRDKFDAFPEGVGGIASRRLMESHQHWQLYQYDYCASTAALTLGGSPWFVVEQDKCMLRLAKVRLKELKAADQIKPEALGTALGAGAPPLNSDVGIFGRARRHDESNDPTI